MFQIVADEDAQHRRRGLMTAQTMIVSGTGGRNAQQFRIFIHGLQDSAQKQQELLVAAFWRKQVLSIG